jgi:biopolymer transport protein ExbB
MKNIRGCIKQYLIANIGRYVLFFGTFCCSLLHLLAQPFGYLYSKTITIDTTLVSGSTDFIDFPILMHTTDPDLRSVANGGHVFSDSGFDIIFTQSDCSLSLYHEVESYNPVTGELLTWIRIPTLFASTNTVIHMYYGNTSVLATTSSPNTWSGEYNMVLHLGQNPGGGAPQMLDASPSGNSGTSAGAMNAANVVPAQVGNGLSFDGVNDCITIPDFDYSSAPLGFTVSFWFRVVNNAGTSYQYMFSHNNYGLQHSLNIYFAENSVPVLGDPGELKTIFMDMNDALSTDGLDAGAGFADGNWHYYAFVVGNAPGGDWVYLDGVLKSTLSFQGSDAFTPPGFIALGARVDFNATRFLLGFLDEVRISNEYRSQDWIITEYVNQTTPTAYFSFGPEVNAAINCTPLPVEISFFDVTESDNRSALATWITLAEINNDFFVLEKSQDAIQFIPVAEIDGAGNSNVTLNYSYVDHDAFEGTSYYRLKQVDFNGAYSYSDIRSINFEGIDLINTYPNPSNGIVNFDVYSTLASKYQVSIFDCLGRVVITDQVEIGVGKTTYTLDINGYAKGAYMIVIRNEDNVHHISKLFYIN